MICKLVCKQHTECTQERRGVFAAKIMLKFVLYCTSKTMSLTYYELSMSLWQTGEHIDVTGLIIILNQCFLFGAAYELLFSSA